MGLTHSEGPSWAKKVKKYAQKPPGTPRQESGTEQLEPCTMPLATKSGCSGQGLGIFTHTLSMTYIETYTFLTTLGETWLNRHPIMTSDVG